MQKRLGEPPSWHAVARLRVLRPQSGTCLSAALVELAEEHQLSAPAAAAANEPCPRWTLETLASGTEPFVHHAALGTLRRFADERPEGEA